jgi:hypothetical protein
MPIVEGKEYPYTKKGKSAAKRAELAQTKKKKKRRKKKKHLSQPYL